MNKKKKEGAAASMDNIYKLNGKSAGSQGNTVWIAAHTGDVCSQHCTDSDRGRCLQHFRAGKSDFDPVCHADRRNRYFDPVVSCVADWFRTAYRYGNQFYLCINFQLHRSHLWLWHIMGAVSSAVSSRDAWDSWQNTGRRSSRRSCLPL